MVKQRVADHQVKMGAGEMTTCGVVLLKTDTILNSTQFRPFPGLFEHGFGQVKPEDLQAGILQCKFDGNLPGASPYVQRQSLLHSQT